MPSYQCYDEVSADADDPTPIEALDQWDAAEKYAEYWDDNSGEVTEKRDVFVRAVGEERYEKIHVWMEWDPMYYSESVDEPPVNGGA